MNVVQKPDREVKYHDERVGRLTLQWSACPEYVPFAGRFIIPSRFDVILEDDPFRGRLEFAVEDGRPQCVAVHRLEGGPPISGRLLRRLPFDYVARHAVVEMTRELQDLSIEEVDPLRGVPGASPQLPDLEADARGRVEVWAPVRGEETRAHLWEAAKQRHPLLRGARLTDDHLRDVAECYRSAFAAGLPPTQTVARTWPCSSSTAGRWVAEARVRGFLGSATRRRAGEATAPARR